MVTLYCVHMVLITETITLSFDSVVLAGSVVGIINNIRQIHNYFKTENKSLELDNWIF